MDYQLLKCLLSHAFWKENRQYLNSSLFADEIRELYEVLNRAHGRYEKDITTEELSALWRNENPVASRAQVRNVEAVIGRVNDCTPYDQAITVDLIQSLWRRETGRKAAELGVAIAEGQSEAFGKLDLLVQGTKESFLPPQFATAEITKDIEELLSVTSNDNRWQFNIRELYNKVYGIGPGEFGIVFARPETGKTAFGVSLSAGPGGFCSQGARVLIAGNEEDPRRTMLRAVSAYSGMDAMAITVDPLEARSRFNDIIDNFSVIGIHGWTVSQLEAYVEKHSPDVLITDNYDKVGLDVDVPDNTQKLRALYTFGREMTGRRNLAHIAVSQASVDGEGKTILTPDMMEGSKTGKFAEGDLIIGIGKYPDNTDGTFDPIRFLTVGKNKLNGWHGTITCKIEPAISRYVN